ncbi:hypothetical protein B0H10DRAFT_1379692 [Mycena sp. CBHHK59/15]|nr:hypothetical protein B0H10DRAFT_1379692 [Mycena sp. CBHHK59/15]
MRHTPQKLWMSELSQWLLCGKRPTYSVDVSDPCLTSTVPVAKIPVEILGEIFEWSLGYWVPMTDEKPSLVFQPLILSHVSSHWRRVALSMPMLWSTIWIDRPRAAHLSMVPLWIERSRNCLLSIYLRQSDPKSCHSLSVSDEHDLTDEILALLMPHVRRWHTIDFTFRTIAQHSLLSFPRNEAVALKCIALQVDSWDTTSADLLQSTLYSQPSLRSIQLWQNSNQKHVPWKQLTHLEADLECTIDTCLSILATSPTLARATFTCSADPDWLHTPFTHSEQYLTLPAMVSMSINASRIDLTPLFSRLTLPALRSLALDYRYVPRIAQDHQSLHSLLERSSCNLESFSLHETCRMRDDERHISYFKSPYMAHLTELEMKVDMTDNILNFLTYSATDGLGQLPNLRDIVLSDCRGDHLSDEALRKMTSSRLLSADSSSSPAFLRSAELHLRLKQHSDSVLLTEKNRDGLRLRLELLTCFCNK